MTRTCGNCTLCCRLVPVEELHKEQNVRCGALNAWRRCTVYAHRPISCRLWSCAWLEGETTMRPDQAHYVIDTAYDVIKMQDDETGKSVPLKCLQVWIDPHFPEAVHRPELLEFLERVQQLTIARFSREDAVFIIPKGYGGAPEAIFKPSTCVEEIEW